MKSGNYFQTELLLKKLLRCYLVSRQLFLKSDKPTVFLSKIIMSLLLPKIIPNGIAHREKMSVPIMSKVYQSHLGGNQRQFIQGFVVRLCFVWQE